jgi:primosomal protein N' (replication factor Y)
VFALVLPDLGDAAVPRPYSYLIPPHLAGAVVVGGRVTVPLGTRMVTGYVLGIADTCDTPPAKVKAIVAVRASQPAFTAEQAALAQWMADECLCPLSEALRPCLVEPGGLSPKRRWQVVEARAVTTLLPDPTLNAVLAYLREHPDTGTPQITARFGDAGTAALEALRRDGFIRPSIGPRVKEREVQAVLRALAPEALCFRADALPARAAKQASLLRWAAAHLPGDAADPQFSPLTVPEVARRAGVGDAVVRACLEKGWLRQETAAVRRNPWDGVHGRKAVPPPLTLAQVEAVEAIGAAVRTRESRSFLLFGVTGSGKTEVFLHAIEEVLARGRQAIVLVPEISLTAQAMELYHGRFPGKVAVLHSHLSPGERFDEWARIAAGDATVVLGARSAIFAPCPDPGLIVVDEEHESSYKQESSPRYHAREVALQRSALCGAPVVLASATPSLESMRAAELGRHTLLKLPTRIEARPLPTVRLVDLRRMTSGARILSAPLRQGIAKRLADGQQTILFLNRRGFAPILLCGGCGHKVTCPNCAVTVTYHKEDRTVRCHHCDHVSAPPDFCPTCRTVLNTFRGVGTEQLEEEVRKLFPAARVGRLDRDTTTRKGSHRAILGSFGREELDILIGTQMVAKGLDFPKVTLVGVICADNSLAISDFRAPERTFQLLTQVAGRAGRSEWPGEVLIQTWQPEHDAVRCAVEHDYPRFYARELRQRGETDACWPPLTSLVNVVVSGENEAEVKTVIAALARRAREEGAGRTALPAMATPELPGLLEFLSAGAPEPVEEDPFGAEALLGRELPDITVNDPAPCPLARLRGRYRYHLVLRGQDRTALHRIARALQEIAPPKGVSITMDPDPLSLA